MLSLEEKSAGWILWEPWILVQNWMAVHSKVVEVFQSGFSGDKTVFESANKHVQPSCTLWHSCCFSASSFYFTPTKYSHFFIVCHWDTLLEQFRVYGLSKRMRRVIFTFLPIFYQPVQGLCPQNTYSTVEFTGLRPIVLIVKDSEYNYVLSWDKRLLPTWICQEKSECFFLCTSLQVT